jgi:adenylate kinase family enzyme
MTAKKKIIVLIGGPGVGKGTFSKMLMARGNYNYIGVGALLRQLPPTAEIHSMISAGKLVPDNILFDLLSKKICNDSDIILDGFPRKLSQAKWLVKNYADTYDIHILNLVVPIETLIQRINKRITDGSARADDMNSDTIRSRLKIFLETTIPALDWLRDAKKIKFSNVDVSGNLDNNLSEIITALAK